MLMVNSMIILFHPKLERFCYIGLMNYCSEAFSQMKFCSEIFFFKWNVTTYKFTSFVKFYFCSEICFIFLLV